jgi:DNA-binding response OmpR family regulator
LHPKVDCQHTLGQDLLTLQAIEGQEEKMPGQKTILIIDDNPAVIEALQSHLTANGYDVISASDGREGLKKAQEEKPDLVLLDITMPRVNGYQICRELKQDPKTKNIKIIILSGNIQESDAFWGKESGADDYVTKPFDNAELLKRIEDILLK